MILDENNPLNFKPNTDNFDDAATNSDQDSDDEINKNDDDYEDDDDKVKKDGIYRPPKLAPIQCGK